MSPRKETMSHEKMSPDCAATYEKCFYYKGDVLVQRGCESPFLEFQKPTGHSLE